jgi:membrane-bound lytic murein transglycosylase D
VIATRSAAPESPMDKLSVDSSLPPPANEPYMHPPAATWGDSGANLFDTWRVMNEGMAFAPDINGPTIDIEVTKYRANPSVIGAVVERASLYLPYVTRRLVENDLPPELALLPFIESAYNPRAISPGGAAGLWQIQPGTGDVLGLKRDQWYDGRQDVARSTDAVISYFNRLHQHFDGDWLLALAAYNSGEGTVSKAIQRNLDQGKDTDFWALDLPEHTRSYVPRFLALARMFQDPEEYQLRLPHLDESGPLESVAVPRQISLTHAAQLAEMDYDILKRLNTGLKRDVTPPQNPYEILLPLDAAQRFEAALVASPHTTAPTQQVLSQLPETKAPTANYRVRAGDTLWTIARRFKVSHETLMRWNKIDNPRRLRPGQYLKVAGG